MTDEAVVPGSDDHERFTEPGADRPPTPDEEDAADRAALDVDLGEVGEHYTEMADLGKHVQGEGDIVSGD